jgi:hypothetical protein
LEDVLGQVQAVDVHTFLAPRKNRSRPSIDPAGWDELAPLDPFLDAWFECSAAAELQHDIRQPNRPIVHPVYEVVPQIRSRHPNLATIREVVPSPVFESANRMQLVVAQLCDLDLRALAEVCLRQFGHSELARLYKDGLDPYGYTAEAFQVMAAGLPGEPSDSDGNVQQRWMQAAKAILFGVPRACGDSTIRRLAATQYGVELSVVLVEQLYDLVTEQLFPEFKDFLADDTAATLAANLGRDAEGFVDRYEKEFGEFHSPTLRYQLRRFGPTSNLRSQHVIRRLQQMNRDPRREALWRNEFSADLYEMLLGRAIVTATGRIWGQLPFCSARRTVFLGLADDVMKAALYAVVAAGYRLIGVRRGEFVVEVTANQDTDEVADDLQRRAETGASRVLTNVPIRCRAAAQERW